MANLPKIQFQPEFDKINQAFRDVQSYVDRNPVSVKIKTDARSLTELGNGLGRVSGLATEFEKSLEAANARVLAFGASVGVIAGVQRSFSNLVKSTIEVEDAFKKIAVVGDQFAKTAAQLNQFGQGLFDVARQTGQSFDVAASAALEFARQGQSAVQTLQLTKDALVLAKLSGLDATKSVESLSAAYRTFQKEGLTSNQILQKLVAVDNAFAVSAGDLSEALSRTGASAQNAGIKFDDLLGLVTSLKEQTALSGSVIGNALNSIFTRIRRPEILNQLENLQIRTLEVSDGVQRLRSASDVLRDIGKNSGALNELTKQGLFEDIGGIFQINRLIALVDDLGKGQGRASLATQKSASATNEADKAIAKLNSTLGTTITNLVTTGKEFGAAFGSFALKDVGPLIQSFSDSIKGVANLLNSEGDSIGGNLAKAIAKSFGDVLTGPGAVLAGFAAGKFLLGFGRFAIDSLKDLFKLNESTKQQAAIQSSILGILTSRQDVQAKILSLNGNEVAQAKILEGIYAKINAEKASAIGLSGRLASTLVSRGSRVGSSGIPGRSAAKGYVPDLIQAEYSDIKKGVGGANKNAGVVLINDFPFGGGKKGPMVANTSEGIVPMGNSAAVLNKDMLDKMGYGKRAAKGDLPYLSKGENEIRATLQKKRQDEIKRLQKEASDAQKASAQADKAASKAAEKAAKAAEKAEKDASKEAERALKRRIAESKKAEAERQRAEKASQEAAKKAVEAELRASKAKEQEFSKNFPITAQLRRDQQLRASGKLLPPISGGFGAFGRLSEGDIKGQNRQRVLSQVGNTLSGGIFNQRPSYNSEEAYQKARAAAIQEAQDEASRRVRTSNLVTGNIGFRQTSGGNPDMRRDVINQVGSAFRDLSIRSQLQNIKGGSSGTFGANFRKNTEEAGSQIESFSNDVQKVKQNWREFGANLALTSGVFFALKDVAGNFAEQFGVAQKKTVDAMAQAAGAFYLISKIGKDFGGVDIFEALRNPKGGTFGKAFSIGKKTKAAGGGSLTSQLAATQELGAAAAGSFGGRAGLALGRGLGFLGPLVSGVGKFVPILGQVVLGFGLLDGVLKTFGIDVVDRLRISLGGLDEAGEKAKASIDNFALRLTQSEGISANELASRSGDRFQAIQARLTLSSSGKKDAKKLTDEEAIAEERSKRISDAIAGIKLPRTKKIAGIDIAIRDLSENTQKIILEQVQLIGELGETDLRKLAESQSNDSDLKKAAQKPIEELRIQFIKTSLESAVRIAGQTGYNVNEEELKQNLGLFLSTLFSGYAEQLKNASKSLAPTATEVVAKNIQELIRARDSFAERISNDAKLITGQLSTITQSRAFDVFGPIAKAKLTGSSELRQAQLSFQAEAAKKTSEIYGQILGEIDKQVSFKSSDQGSKFIDQLGKLDISNLEDFKSTVSEVSKALRDQGADIQRINEIERSAISTSQSFIASRDIELSQLKLGISLRVEEAQITDDFNRKLLKVNEGLQQFELANVKLRGELERLDIRKNLALEFSSIGTRSPQEAFGRQSQIEGQFLSERQSIERKILENQLKIETTRELYTAENTIALQTNAKATYDLINKLTGVPLQSAQNVGPSGFFNGVSSGQISGLAKQISGGSISAGGGTEADFVKIIREKLNGQLPDNVALAYAKALQNATNSLQSQEVEFSEAQKTQKDQQDSNFKLRFSIDAYRKSLDDAANSLEEQAKFSSQSVGERNSALRKASQLRFLSSQGPEAGSRYLSSGGAALDQFSDEASQRADDFNRDFTYTVVSSFRDGLVGAVGDAISGAKSLKEALLDAALSFANTLRDKALNNLADVLFSKVGNSNSGGSGSGIISTLIGSLFGGAQKRAAGGPITGGSGNKDDVPILGMGGEFMINKQSVKKYGPQLFEALNEGRLQKMAKGGLVDPSISGKSIIGAANLKKFAGQSFTSGATDKILNLGGGAASVELEPESLRLTNFARQSGNPLQSATQEAKDQALSLVFQDQQLRAQYKEQVDALKKAEKEKQKQLLVSLAVAAVGAGVSSAFSSKPGGSGSLYGDKTLPTYNAKNSYVGMTSSLSNRNVISSISSASNTSAGITKAFSGGAVDINELLKPNQVGTYNGIIPALRASGGPVGGNGYGDNVPAMLSGGEFVMNRKAAKNLGLANLSAANSGQSIGLSEEKSEELNEKLLSKLDELVEKMSAQNNVTVNVSMDKNGQPSTSESGQQNEDQKNMNRRIKDAVVQILQEEKRLGGVLRK